MATVLDDVLGFINSVRKDPIAAISELLGTFTTARQAIRTVAGGIASAVSQSAINQALKDNPDVPLSPAVLADMAIRNLKIGAGNPTPDSGLIAEASLSGVDPVRFAAMTADTGESYGIDQALSLWHRGSYLVAPVVNTDTALGAPPYVTGASLGSVYGIEESELDTVIYYSRVRDQFISDLKKLSWSTMSPADAIDSLVKGRTSPDLAKALFEAGGGIPEQFDLLFESAGDSIGVVKAVELHAHKEITDQQLKDVIDQSRINPRFYDVALKENRKWLAPYQIERAVAGGVVDAPTAMAWMIEDGYPEDQAAAFAATGMAGSTHTHKAETEGMILSDFEAQIITEAQATEALANMGYDAQSIPFILSTYVARRVITMRNAAITRTRLAYIEYLITEAQARVDMVALGVPEAAISQFLTAWGIEQQTNVKRLSMAQVGKLVEDGIIDATNAVARWTQMGYLPEEANLLLYIYQPGSKAVAGTTPTVGTVPPSDTPVS